MKKNNNDLSYIYRISPDGADEKFEIKITPGQPFHSADGSLEKAPEWTLLGFCRCSVCPFDESSSKRCPAALSVAGVIEFFKDLISYHKVNAEVFSPGRKTSASLPAQEALGSLMGLCLAVSGCPVLKDFETMARFHLPFASTDETMYRIVGNYLIKQYFIKEEGGEPDWRLEGLTEFYDRVARLNTNLAERIRLSTNEDAAVNAVIILDNYAKNVKYMFENVLEKIKNYYYFK